VIIVISASKIFFACPNIYCGKTADRVTVFARYRWGRLSVRVQPAGVDDGLDGATGQSILEIDHGGKFDGFLEYDELRKLTRDLIQWPDTCQ
jgi:hypothetical protein